MSEPVFAACYKVEPQRLVRAIRQFTVQPIVVLQVVPNIPGVWTDYEADYELIRVGFPSISTDAYFQYFSPSKNSKTAFHHVLERTLYCRKSHVLYCAEPAFAKALRVGLRPLDVRIGWGNKFSRPYWLSETVLEKALNESPLQA
ncbi:MAG: hypothetical protein ACFCU1_12300 [Sumerlaeia bacterium]